MILDDCGAGRCRVARSPRPVDRVDGTVGALKVIIGVPMLNEA